MTYEDWTILWWKWLLSIPKSTNPIIDPTGKNSDVNQPDKRVLFLCQTIESSDPFPCRVISVQLETSIFMPIINWISIGQSDGNTDDELSCLAKKRMDVVSNLQFSLNDTPIRLDLEKYRISSSAFDVYFPPDNIFNVIPPGNRRVFSDGYWIFLKPLKSDSVITTYGACSKALTKIGITYKIKLLHRPIGALSSLA